MQTEPNAITHTTHKQNIVPSLSPSFLSHTTTHHVLDYGRQGLKLNLHLHGVCYRVSLVNRLTTHSTRDAQKETQIRQWLHLLAQRRRLGWGTHATIFLRVVSSSSLLAKWSWYSPIPIIADIVMLSCFSSLLSTFLGSTVKRPPMLRSCRHSWETVDVWLRKKSRKGKDGCGGEKEEPRTESTCTYSTKNLCGDGLLLWVC